MDIDNNVDNNSDNSNDSNGRNNAHYSSRRDKINRSAPSTLESRFTFETASLAVDL